MSQFPSLKAKRLLAVLKREPLAYVQVRCVGSHRTLRSKYGYPDLMFSFHEDTELAPGLVKKILTKDVGLGEEDARKLL